MAGPPPGESIGRHYAEREGVPTVRARIAQVEGGITIVADFPTDSASLAGGTRIKQGLQTPCAKRAAERLLAGQTERTVKLPNLDFSEAESRAGLVHGRVAQFEDSGDPEAYLLCVLLGSFKNEQGREFE